MIHKYAEVIVDISHEKLDRPFTYRIPAEMRDAVVMGSVVRIPFGNGDRTRDGYVVGFADHSELPEEKLKEILEVRTGRETAEERMVALAAWMSRTYGSTMIQALKTVVPVRKRVKAVTERTVSVRDPEKLKELAELFEKKHWSAKKRVLEALEKGPMSWEALLQASRTSAAVLRGMQEDGYLEVDAKDGLRRLIPEAKNAGADHTGSGGAEDAGCTGSGYAGEDSLTDEQRKALQAILEEEAGDDRTVLINGVTGSGKTVVYTELAARTLAEGKQAIVLIPEIALTRQTVMRFVARFGDQVSFLHSRLSEGERYDQMKAARNGAVRVMVGPRSALFTPFPNLGLIVIDEEHEESYHSETMPRYHAREVAIYRGKTEGAHVVLGSATPSVSSAYHVKKGDYFGVSLKKRYGAALLPATRIVDMREEMKSGNRSILSRTLSKEIGNRTARGEQVMLFLNRRGYSGQVTCRSCGHVIKCPHCDVALTRHRNGKLICHYCGYERDDVKTCPECGSPYIGGMTVGTEQVEEVVRRTFPGIRTLRMDADTTRGKEGHAEILRAFGNHEADVLIGTQMIVKGHDFANVTLVGVLLADLSLNADDYRASERTYQLVTQAVGRAGRGSKPGLAVIQTYQPEHFAVVSAASQDYDAFYKEEILFRSVMNYPPCGEMAAILGSAPDERLLKTGMKYIRDYIRRFDPGDVLHAIGPAPQSIRKVKDLYREVIYIRNADREKLVRAKDLIEEYTAINRGFDGIRIQFDFHM